MREEDFNFLKMNEIDQFNIIQKLRKKIDNADRLGQIDKLNEYFNRLGIFYEFQYENQKALICYELSLIIGDSSALIFDNLHGISQVAHYSKQFGRTFDALRVLIQICNEFQ